MNHKIRIGWLHCDLGHSHDGVDCCWTFEVEGGEPYPVVFEDESQAPPVNRKIALCMAAEPDAGGHYQVCSHDRWWAPVGETFAAQTLNKRHTLVIAAVAPDASEATRARLLAVAEDMAETKRNYWLTLGRHVEDVETRAILIETTDNPGVPLYSRLQDIKRQVAAMEFADFAPNYFQVLGGYSTSYCGHGEFGGQWSVVYANCPEIEHTGPHEDGHKYRLMHAGTVNSVGDESEYGDQWDNLGSRALEGLNSIHLGVLGYESDREIRLIEGTEQVILNPVEMPARMLHPVDDQTIVIRVPRQPDFYLDTRKCYPCWPYSQDIRNIDAVEILERRGPRSIKHGLLRDGETRRLPNDVTLIHRGNQGERNAVDILYPGHPAFMPEPVFPTGFAPVSSAVELGPQHSGLYWSRHFPGQGFWVVIRNGRLKLYFYGFDHRGNFRYWFATVPLDIGIEEFPLFTTSGPDNEDVQVGTARLYMYDDTRGVFEIDTTEYGSWSVEIFPAHHSQHERNDGWVDPAIPHEGMTFTFLEDGNRCAGWWFTKGPVPPFPHRDSDLIQSQRWFQLGGLRGDDGRYRLTIRQVRDIHDDPSDPRRLIRGGRFLAVNQVKEVSVGNATLEVSGDRMELDYTMHESIGPPTSGVMRLQRV